MDVLSVSMIWMSFFMMMLTLVSTTINITILSFWWTLSVTLVVIFILKNILLFFILFEVSLIPILLIIIHNGNQPERVSAGMYFLFYTGIFSFPYLMIILYMIMSNMFKFDMIMYSMIICPLMKILLVLPFLVKMPISGLHFWLPKAHVEASTSGSMLLAGLLLKLGSYGVFRILIMIQFLFVMNIFWIILSLITSTITMMQVDMKKFIAFSSVTHMTFLMVGLMMSLKLCLISVLLMSLAHGWASMGMFLAAGSVSNSTQTRLGILVKVSHFYWMILILGILLMVNSSIPPLPAFFSEMIMVTSVSIMGMWGGLFFMMLSFFVCYYNMILFLWFSHSKAYLIYSNKQKILTSSIIFLLSSLSITSLGFIFIL